MDKSLQKLCPILISYICWTAGVAVFPEIEIGLYWYDGNGCLAAVDGEPISFVQCSEVVVLIEAVHGIVLKELRLFLRAMREIAMFDYGENGGWGACVGKSLKGRDKIGSYTAYLTL